ncbi:hypothetical protein GOBAR_AA19919 [Gossypium barbadense]|uniref:Pentacotripeptide-repeat region of PRORP domain-containing protein n=1 Tax=Gossypium barbadense TaxID=3634 RepID=A0A2P5XBN0_GOSBA|nr:hypothetical protein GOBAR_AA19919 [Gossypium barbadense]
MRIPLRSIADTLCRFKSGELERSKLVNAGNVFLGYGGEPLTKSIQVQIVDALRLGERSRASSLLLDFGNGNQSLKANDFVYILNYCARSPDPLFVMETWRLMEEKEIDLNNTCYLLMVRALCRGGYLEEACKFMKFLRENHGTYPLLPVYNCFLGACAKMKSVIHANQCLDLMELQRVGKNEITYSVLLKLAVWQQDLSAARDIWEDYIKHYSLNIISLRRFIWSFTRLKDLKSAYETLQHMVALAISGKHFVSRTDEGRLYSSRLDIPIPSKSELGSQNVQSGENEQSVAFKFDTDSSNIERSKSISATVGMLNNYKNLPVMEVLRLSINDVLHACAQARAYGLAEQLMMLVGLFLYHKLLMQNLGLQPSSHTYDGFVRAIIQRRGFGAGLEMLKVMEERNLKPHDSTLAALSVQCSKALELDLAEALLEQVCECPYPYPFNAFLEACDNMRRTTFVRDFMNVPRRFRGETSFVRLIDLSSRSSHADRDRGINRLLHSRENSSKPLKVKFRQFDRSRQNFLALLAQATQLGLQWKYGAYIPSKPVGRRRLKVGAEKLTEEAGHGRAAALEVTKRGGGVVSVNE